MDSSAQRREKVLARIRAAEHAAGLNSGHTELLAVSKQHSPQAIRSLYRLGQRKFGENYVAEALEKISLLEDLDIEWHYIGPIQSNKTRDIARHFHWVHSIDREKILRRLGEQRPPQNGPLNCCLQVRIGDETSKSGTDRAGAERLLELAQDMPGLTVRGLMAIPPPSDETRKQRQYCAQLRRLFEDFCRQGYALDTLSMGMSQDLEAAIAEGATMVRVGTALFGPRAE